MKYVYAVLISLLLASCTSTPYPPPSYPGCTSEECQLERMEVFCGSHEGIQTFSSIDADHYYAVCNDDTYFVISYSKLSTFKLNLDAKF